MTGELSAAARRRIYEVIAAGPFGLHVGVEVAEAEVDRVLIRLPEAAHVMNGVGIVHGGATATLVDVAATAAAWATPDATDTTRGTTVSLTINFIGAGQQEDLLAEGRVVSRGGTLTIVDVVVHGASGRLVAKAQGTYKLDLARDRRLASA